MIGFFKKSIFLLVFVALYNLSYCGNVDINALVNSFQEATDIQKAKIILDNLNKEASAFGIVSNVQEHDFFNADEDISGTYYQVTTKQQKTDKNIPYQIVFLYKDKDKAAGIDKGMNIQESGKIIRIADERLQTAVWVFYGELTETDKTLLK